MAFTDMLAAKRSDDETQLYHARSNYFTARAQQMMTPGAGGSKAYQNDPFWKTMKVEDAARKMEHDQQQILQKKWAMNGTPPDEQQEDLKKLQKDTDAYRQRLYMGRLRWGNRSAAQRLKRQLMKRKLAHLGWKLGDAPGT